MSNYLPNFILPKSWSTDTKITYTPGPTGNFNRLTTGNAFEGQYAVWYEQNTNLFKLKAISGENEIAYVGMPGGLTSGYFSPSNTLSQDKNRISNVTACFDNQSVLVLGYQDNGDTNVGYINRPFINIGYSGGARLTGWQGWNPELFNNVQVNYPHAIPNILTGRFFTGLVGCYYTNKLGNNLYVRYQNDNFSTEYLIHSGLSAAENRSIRYNLPTTKNPYNQFKKIILRKDAQGNLISLASKPTINYGFDNFDRNQTQENLKIFTGGYGNWFRENSLAISSGISYERDRYFSDQIVAYLTGEIPQSGLKSGVYFLEGNPLTGLTIGSTLSNEGNFIVDSGSVGGYWGRTSLTNSYYSSGYSGFSDGSGIYMQNGDYFYHGHDSRYLLNNFSVECWFARSGWAHTFARIIDKDVVGGFAFYRANDANTLSFACANNYFDTSYSIPDLTWTHAAFVRSGTVATMFVNGLTVLTTTVTTATLTSTFPILLGFNNTNANEWFRGYIDEFRLWSYARSSGEIASGYNQIIQPNSSGLLSYYRIA
jgi:hypothetical protein